MSLKVKEVRELLDKFDDDLEVFFNIGRGRLSEIYVAYPSTYGFFGKGLPCVLLDEDDPQEEMEETLNERA